MRHFYLLLTTAIFLFLNLNFADAASSNSLKNLIAQTQQPMETSPSSASTLFNSLQQLLSAKNWQAADVETRRLVQQWAYPNGDLYGTAQLNAISCDNLKTIDKLWVQASEGRFGFSVQQQLWQQNSTPNSREKVEALGKKVGWVRTTPLTDDEFSSKWFAATWLMENELNFTANAPVGHLPWNGISAERILSLVREAGPGCGSCSIDAVYLQEERNYQYLPAFFDRVKTCLATPTTSLPPLENALAAANWKEANRITSLRILELAGQTQRGYLVATDIRKLPCQELRQIDQQWVKYSQGQFGLSVQGKIWQNLKGKNYEDSLNFEQLVGWTRTQPIFDLKSAPKGHLPLRPVRSEGMMNAWGGGWIQEISSRLKSCGGL